MSPMLLEQFVLSAPYFERHGLLLALDGAEPVGFVHAGFGPSKDGSAIATCDGVTCVLMVSPHEQRDEILRELLRRSEQHLRSRGAQTLYAGGNERLNPFYLGLYEGSQLPGILASNETALALYRDCGYKEVGRRLILQRDLSDFRPVVDRKQMLVRRSHTVEATFDPPVANWWEACTIGVTDRTCFTVYPQMGEPACGSVTFRDIGPFGANWGARQVGLLRLEISPESRRKGLATFLTGQGLRQLQTHGASRCEVQVAQENEAAIGLFRKLGFAEVDQGVILRKPA